MTLEQELQELAQKIASELASRTIKVKKETGLSQQDREIFNKVDYSTQLDVSKIYYQEHFALRPGWKPNQRGYNVHSHTSDLLRQRGNPKTGKAFHHIPLPPVNPNSQV